MPPSKPAGVALACARLAKALGPQSASPEELALELEFWTSIKDSDTSATNMRLMVWRFIGHGGDESHQRAQLP